MNRNVLATGFIILFSLLICLVTDFPVAQVANAHPYMHDYVEESTIPLPDGNRPPTLQISSPTNATAYNSRNITLAFNVTFNKSNTVTLGLTELYYRASWQTINHNIDLTALFVENNHSPPTSFSVNLTDVPEGPRWIEIYATAKAFAYETYHQISGILYTQHYVSYKATATAITNFTIDLTTPKITVLSLENQIFNDESIVPLHFNVDEQTSWIGYSLDNQVNTTIEGNTILTGLTDGSHNIILYANDTAGNVGKSETVFFTINAQPLSTPTITPSNSPSSPSTLSPSPLPSPTQKPTSSLTPNNIKQEYTSTIIIGLAIASVVAGLLIYCTKRKELGK